MLDGCRHVCARVGERNDLYGDDTVEQAIELLKQGARQQMRAKIASIPDGDYRSTTIVDFDGVINELLEINLVIRKRGEDLELDIANSSPPCRGPINSAIATTKLAIYLAIKHIFPEVPINAGAFEPLIIPVPTGTLLDAKYPRPVSGCAAEVSQRIAEAVFLAALPERLFVAPAGTSGNLAIGAWTRILATAS